MNWNILVIKGKEKNKNFVSSGERKQNRSICNLLRLKEYKVKKSCILLKNKLYKEYNAVCGIVLEESRASY